MKWAIHYGFPKCCFSVHYNTNSLGHFLGRSIWVCQFACVSRAFRHTLTMGSPLVLWFQNTSTFLMYVFSAVLFTFFSPVPCVPYYKLLPVFHSFLSLPPGISSHFPMLSLWVPNPFPRLLDCAFGASYRVIFSCSQWVSRAFQRFKLLQSILITTATLGTEEIGRCRAGPFMER